MSAALQSDIKTPRKRVGRGQGDVVTQRARVSAKKIADPSQEGSRGQCARDTHEQRVPTHNFAVQGNVLNGDDFGHARLVTHIQGVEVETSVRENGEAGQEDVETQCCAASLRTPIDPKLIQSINSLYREYRGLQSAVTAMTLRIQADERWRATWRVKSEGGVINVKKFPEPTKEDIAAIKALRPRYYATRSYTRKMLRDCEKQFFEAASRLPVAPWVDTVVGVGISSLASIIGVAGDLYNYDNPSKLWKRFSLHVVNDKAARRIKGDASQQFVPKRRAEMHVIGTNLVMKNGPYADLYRTRKAYEIAKVQEQGKEVRPAGKIPKGKEDKYMSSDQVNKRALRYIEKRLLRELWCAWRATESVNQ